MSKKNPLKQGQLESLIIYACRYVVGRSTYAPHEFMDIVEPRLSELSDGCLAELQRDIIREGTTWGYGMKMDEDRWKDFSGKIDAEIQKRNAEEFERRVKKKLKSWDVEDVPCAHGMRIFCPIKHKKTPFLGCGEWCLLRQARLEVEAEMEREGK